jgi:hypothetical protein
MNTHDDNQDRLRQFVREALPPVELKLDRDLWPAMLRRLDEKQATTVPWFDWALGAGLIGLAALFPASIPLFLYCL